MKTEITKKTVRKGRKYVKILGINVISSSSRSLLTRVNNFLSHNTKFYIVTPNPELVLMAQKNKLLKEALNSSELPIPDGIGLDYASRFLYGRSLNIIPGRKLFLELVELADKNHWKVFLLGGLSTEAELVAAKLKVKNVKYFGAKGERIETHRGPVVDKSANPIDLANEKLEREAIEKINKFAPKLLFVAMTNPKQEIWIHKNLQKLNIGGAMAVGGTFRYIAGLSTLPPSWMEKTGLEWLFRLITEPYRVKRIWNAVIVFPWKIFLHKITSR